MNDLVKRAIDLDKYRREEAPEFYQMMQDSMIIELAERIIRLEEGLLSSGEQDEIRMALGLTKLDE